MTTSDENKDLEIGDIEPKIYEVGFHIVPTIAEDDVSSASNVIRDIVESSQGVIISEGNPLLLQLAYPMDHIVENKKSIFSSAYFGWIKFQIDPENIKMIKEGLEKDDNVFRFLITKTVRESTLEQKQVFQIKKEPVSTSPEKKKSPKEEISEAEVDKAIEELVVE